MNGIKRCECGHLSVTHLHNGTCTAHSCYCTGYTEDHGGPDETMAEKLASGGEPGGISEGSSDADQDGGGEDQETDRLSSDVSESLAEGSD